MRLHTVQYCVCYSAYSDSLKCAVERSKNFEHLADAAEFARSSGGHVWDIRGPGPAREVPWSEFPMTVESQNRFAEILEVWVTNRKS